MEEKKRQVWLFTGGLLFQRQKKPGLPLTIDFIQGFKWKKNRGAFGAVFCYKKVIL